MSILHILKEFEGITGTILGVILGTAATLVTTWWQENWGRLQYYFNDVQISYLKVNEYGVYIEAESMQETEYIEVKFRVEVYNSSHVIKPLKDIKAIIVTENNNIVTNLLDVETFKISAGAKRYDELLYINFMPKEINGYNLRFSLDQSNFKDNIVEKIKEIYFAATGVGNRKVKKLIYKDQSRASIEN